MFTVIIHITKTTGSYQPSEETDESKESTNMLSKTGIYSIELNSIYLRLLN